MSNLLLRQLFDQEAKRRKPWLTLRYLFLAFPFQSVIEAVDFNNATFETGDNMTFETGTNATFEMG